MDCAKLLNANAVRIPLADETVQCVVTSPPYWGLRDYGLPPLVWGGRRGCVHRWETSEHYGGGGQPGEKVRWQHTGKGPPGHPKVPSAFCGLCGAWSGSLGLEPSPELYVEHLVAVFREVRRVLKPDGVAWVNLGDSYASGKGTCRNPGGGDNSLGQERKAAGVHPLNRGNASTLRQSGLKPKDLVGSPWRVAFALQADGWWLRSDIIWHKPNPMPESVRDRPTKSHEYVFLLTKSARYFYDAEAVREPHKDSSLKRYEYGLQSSAPNDGKIRQGADTGIYKCERMGDFVQPAGRNRRSVWTIATQGYRGAHFATFPEKLVEPCVLAGTSARGECPICGKVWRRVAGKKFVPQGDVSVERGIRGAKGNKLQINDNWDGFPRGSNCVTTTGWTPQCNHDAEPVPQLVLDPFAGTATVGRVAIKHRRRFVGLELNPEYIGLARERVGGVQVEMAL